MRSVSFLAVIKSLEAIARVKSVTVINCFKVDQSLIAKLMRRLDSSMVMAVISSDIEQQVSFSCDEAALFMYTINTQILHLGN